MLVKVTVLGHRQDVGLIQFVVFSGHTGIEVVGFCRMQGRMRSAQLSDKQVLNARVPLHAKQTNRGQDVSKTAHHPQSQDMQAATCATDEGGNKQSCMSSTRRETPLAKVRKCSGEENMTW